MKNHILYKLLEIKKLNHNNLNLEFTVFFLIISFLKVQANSYFVVDVNMRQETIIVTGLITEAETDTPIPGA